METLIVICLLIVIALLLHDKFAGKKITETKAPEENRAANLPDIMGLPKPVQRLPVPSGATEGQMEDPEAEYDNFDTEIDKQGFAEIPQEELDDVFGVQPDLLEEEDEWDQYREPNGEEGFGLAEGVTFEELTTIGTLLQQDELAPSDEREAVAIARKIQGTELFELMENSIENASQKIALLLDKGISIETDPGSSTMRNGSIDDFDISEFMWDAIDHLLICLN